jgi:flagellar protein FlaG
MTGEEISATGEFSALNSADFASYQSPDGGAHQGAVAANAAAATLGESSAARPVAGSAPAAVATVSSAASAVSAAASSKSANTPSPQDIQSAVDKANDNLSGSNRVLDYRVDAATGLSIATIRNSQTGVVLQQIPGADIIALAKMLAGWSPGKHMLLDLMA